MGILDFYERVERRITDYIDRLHESDIWNEDFYEDESIGAGIMRTLLCPVMIMSYVSQLNNDNNDFRIKPRKMEKALGVAA